MSNDELTADIEALAERDEESTASKRPKASSSKRRQEHQGQGRRGRERGSRSRQFLPDDEERLLNELKE